VSNQLATLMRKGSSVYRDLWIAQSREGFGTEPKPEVVDQHLGYWDTIAKAVEDNEFSELMKLSREAGHYQCSLNIDLSEAVKRTVEATNMIEIAELRSMIVMAVVAGYNSAFNDKSKKPNASDPLRVALMRNPGKYTAVTLKTRDEISPLYDEEMRFYAVESGKVRLYNLLPNGRAITLSILSEGDVFFQWRTQTGSLSCICAEAMAPSRVIGVSEKDLIALLGAQPAAAVDVIGNFARRLTESQVLIEDLMNNSVNLRLYRTLLELAREFGRKPAGGTSVIIDMPLTHQRLADMIGSNRVTVTRKLLELQKRNVIAARGTGSIEILDLDALNRLTVHNDD
jgi:CRP-like cAMP-binding protein